MFDVGLRKLKFGTEAGQGLAFTSPKKPHPTSLRPVPESCPAGGQGKGMAQSNSKPLPGSSRGFQAQLAWSIAKVLVWATNWQRGGKRMA